MTLLVRNFRCRRVLLPVLVLAVFGFFTCFVIWDKSVPDILVFPFNQPLPISVDNGDLHEVPQIQPPIQSIDPRVNVQLDSKPHTIKQYEKGIPITEEEIRGGQPENATISALRDRVRDMMKHAWDGYATYAWGSNELKPVSKTGHLSSVFGNYSLGATIVDGLDTLYIMRLDKEFDNSIKWIENVLDFDKNTMISVFESNIRYLGGLLSSYTFTKKQILLTKAVELAKRLLPAFDTPTGIPKSLVNLKTGDKQNFIWANTRCSILSEFGTLHMEFMYLSELTGDPIYAEKVKRVRQVLDQTDRSNGLFYNYLDPNTHRWCGSEAGLSALGDSFYEYLLKEWIRTNYTDTQAIQWYNSSMDAFVKIGLFQESQQNKLLYVGNYKNGRVSQSMDHLACFVGGMFALSAANSGDPWFKRGVAITHTCRQSYTASAVGLGPEVFSFTSDLEAVAITSQSKHYLLRPETVESYFYLWRFTKDPKYRQWAVDAVEALEKYTRTDVGFSGLRDVYSIDPKYDDVQQSYFLAETLKYLYLIFSTDNLFPLDRWVFNSEAHPLPIQTKVKLM